MINLVHYDIPIEAIVGGAVGLVVFIIIVVVVIAKAVGGRKDRPAEADEGVDDAQPAEPAAPARAAPTGDASRDTAAWQKYASENSLTLGGAHPALQLEGGGHGFNVRFWQVQEESDEYDDDGNAVPGRVKSEAAVSIPVPIGDLSLAREGYFSKTGRNFGGQDIQVFDPQFDTAFIVRHSKPDHCRKILTTAARAALLDAQQAYPDLEVSDQMVRVHGPGTTDIGQVDRVLKTLVGVAAAFGKDG